MSFFDDVINTTKNAAQTAGKKTDEAVRFTKLKIKESQTSSDIKAHFEKLGQMAYEMKKAENPDAALFDAEIEEIDKLYEKLSEINLLLDDPEAPVVWRGPVIAGAVKQFWQEVVWDVDFLFVDMPPGTGDVPLTVFQTLPVDGIVIVSSPQELVGMIVGKAVQMAQMMHVPILGLVENMSYAVCPDCGKHINVFGDSHVDEIADKYKLPVLAKMPIDPELAKEADAGMIEMFAGDYLDNAAQTVAKLLKK